MKKILAGFVFVSAMAACSSNTSKEAEIQQAKQYAIDSMKIAQQEAAAKKAAEQKTVIYKSYNQPAATTTTTTTKNTDKPGWSNKAKGAVVGGVVGAVTGAAVSNKKGKGAIIGGVVGAAGGYGVGAILDKKKKN